MSNSKHIIRFLVTLFLLGVVYSCANMGRPSGGPRDYYPPRYIRSNPKINELNVKRQRIEIEFNEIVKVEKPTEKVVVSPPQKEMFQVRSLGKKIVLTLKDSLQSNTTYTIDFTDAIVDNNENNPMGNFSLSFSTGEVIDSLQFSGILLNAKDLEPITGAYVGLHRNLEDSALLKLRFDRLTTTDAYGRFTIRNVSPGSYRIYALKDANRTFTFDMPSEDIAFVDSIFIPSAEVIGKMDTVWKDSTTIDSIHNHTITRYEPENILMWMFNEELSILYLDTESRPERKKLQFEFSTEQKEIPLLRLVDSNASDWYVTEVKKTETRERGLKSTFIYWITDSTIYKRDTLYVEANYLRTDSTLQRTPFTDTLRFTFRDPKPERRPRNRRQPPPPAPTFGLKTSPPALIDLSSVVRLEWDEPVARFDSSAFYLEKQKDSIWNSISFKLGFDSISRLYHTLIPTGDWDDSASYRVRIDSAGVWGVYGLPNSDINKEFKTRPVSDYGNLFLTISGLEAGQPAFVELLDQADNPKMKAPVIDNECEFWFAPPGKYYLRLIIDENNDGVWTTGDYKTKRQPEKVFYFNAQLDVRSNWDIEQAWNIHELPSEKQKPSELIKNKPIDNRNRVRSQNRNQSRRQNQNNSFSNPSQMMQGGGGFGR